VAGELVAGLVGALGVVFAVFAEDMGADVQGVYDYQGNRVRSVVESNNQVQSQRDYLPLLDTSTNQAKQQTNTLHIGTHILSESATIGIVVFVAEGLGFVVQL
jgi:hypothetical protein